MPTVLRSRFLHICLYITGISIFLLFIRMFFDIDDFYWFLPYNLLLAWVPLGLSMMLYQSKRSKALSGVRQGIITLIWLIFFPNAPYLVTDIIHWQARGVPVWFDFLLLVSFAIAGVVVGIASLALMHRLVQRRFGSSVGWIFVGAVSVLSSLGIYLGRVLRWNSWDVVTQPFRIISDVIRLIHPEAPVPFVLIITTFSFGLFALYSSVLWLMEALGTHRGR